MECKCCFNIINKATIVKCSINKKHIFCTKCPKQAINASLETGTVNLNCIADTECNGRLTNKQLNKCLDKHTIDKLNMLELSNSLSKANLKGLEHCPYCSYAVIYDSNNKDTTFVCMNVKCEKITCRLCKKCIHPNSNCNEDIKLEKRKKEEEAQTKTSIIECPKCKVCIVQDFGCNKIKCNCGTYICSICKKDITENGYAHFKTSSDSKSKCMLFNDVVDNNVITAPQYENNALLQYARIRTESEYARIHTECYYEAYYIAYNRAYDRYYNIVHYSTYQQVYQYEYSMLYNKKVLELKNRANKT